MFGAEVRYTGVSVGYTLAQICGRLRPADRRGPVQRHRIHDGSADLLLVASAISIISLLLWGPAGPQGSRPPAGTPREPGAHQPFRPQFPDRYDQLSRQPDQGGSTHEHQQRLRLRRRRRRYRPDGRHRRPGPGHLRGAGARGVQVELGGEHPSSAHHESAGDGGPAGPRRGGGGQAVRHPLGADGRHDVHHQLRRPGDRPAADVGYRRRPARRLRAGQPVPAARPHPAADGAGADDQRRRSGAHSSPSTPSTWATSRTTTASPSRLRNRVTGDRLHPAGPVPGRR